MTTEQVLACALAVAVIALVVVSVLCVRWGCQLARDASARAAKPEWMVVEQFAHNALASFQAGMTWTAPTERTPAERRPLRIVPEEELERQPPDSIRMGEN